MKKAIAGYEKYFQMGRKAFLSGNKCKPVADPDYMKGYNNEWKGARIGDDKSETAKEAARAWVYGWTMESLRA